MEPGVRDYTGAMQECLELAVRGAGSVSPNPMVGSIVFSAEGVELGKGWHEKYGGPHAEVRAIENAIAAHGKDALKGGTIVVNLEPCNHHGKTPPCSHLIVESGLSMVVIGKEDPNAKARGGIAYLRSHGIDVTVDVLASECFRFNEAFYTMVRDGRPMISVKLAQTLDGFIATESGESKWISGEESRAIVHQMRSSHDIVLTASGTAKADNPRLTVRHAEGKQPVRVVLDTHGVLDQKMHVFSDDYVSGTIAVVGSSARPSYETKLVTGGGRVWRFDTAENRIPLKPLIERLGREGALGAQPVNSILVEAGSRLSSALLKADLLDRLYVFTAPKLFAGGIKSFDGLGISNPEHAIGFAEHGVSMVGGDILFVGYRRGVQ